LKNFLGRNGSACLEKMGPYAYEPILSAAKCRSLILVSRLQGICRYSLGFLGGCVKWQWGCRHFWL